jgi:hypothetical protein
VEKNIVCQDFHRIVRCGEDIAIAVVADGLGSAEHADIGSQTAANVAAEYCEKHINPLGNEITDTIKKAFDAAYDAIEKEAASKEHGMEKYDTTLSLAVLIRDDLYYGHSGDSGIIALTTQGRYVSVTEQQRDSEGRVFPLFFEDKWVFAQYEEKVSAVLLATDGMLETFFPIYIKDNPVSNIHVSLAQFFMDNNKLRIDKVGQEAVQARISDYMEKIPDETVNDDKTVVVLINPSIKTSQMPKEYYVDPDWAELKRKHDEAWKRKAYPGLYKETTPETEPESVLPSVDTTMGKTHARSLPTKQPARKSKAAKIIILIIASTALVLALALIAGPFALRMLGRPTAENGNGDEHIPIHEALPTQQPPSLTATPTSILPSKSTPPVPESTSGVE